MSNSKRVNRFVIADNPTEEEMDLINSELEAHDKQNPYGELDIPFNDINLVLKDHEGRIIGGVITSMKTGVMHLEVLWVEERYRGLGYGRNLVLEAERIGKEKGYTSSQTWTFSFQGPEFYQAIGYKVLGICEVYPENITEFVLMKRLDDGWQISDGNNKIGQLESSKRFTISEDKSEDAQKILGDGLGGYVKEQVGELLKKHPGVRIKLVIRNDNDQVFGGFNGFTALGTLHIEQIWVDERFRGQGYGRQLMMRAEKIAKENGSLSGLTWVLSFQSPEFFQKCGYEVFGISDGYPDPVKEYYFQKRF